MARLTLIYDERDPPLRFVAEDGYPPFKTAILDLGEPRDNLDIYETARRLAELLLERLEQ